MDVRMPDGTTIKNVPEGTTQEELLSRIQSNGGKKAEQTPLPVPYFRGISYAQPPSDADMAAGERLVGELFRGTPADIVSAPLQLVAGLGDLLDIGVRKAAGLPPASLYATKKTSEARNILAGRQGIEGGPATPFVQGLSTGPVVGTGVIGTFLQSLGLTPSNVEEGDDVMKEAAKSGSVALLMHGLGRMFGRRTPTSHAEKRLDTIAAKEELDRTYGMKTGSALARNMEARAERNILLGGIGTKNFAQATHEAIDDKFARRLWARAGQNFDEFTQDHFVAATRNIGSKLNAPLEKMKEVPFGGMRIKASIDDAIANSYNMTRPDELLKAAFILDRKAKFGRISASELNTIADDLRGLATKAYEDNNKAAGDLIQNMYKALREEAINNIPTQAGKDAYRKALKEYANLQIIKDAFVRSADSPRGNIDYTKLKAAINRSMRDGYSMGRADLTDLADLGMSMRSSEVLNEGLKMSPLDAGLYLALNNPMSRSMRERGLIDQQTMINLLRASGLQMSAQ